MTNKAVPLFVAAGLAVALAFPVPAEAQSRRNMKPVGVYLNLGYVNLNSYPKWMTLGPEIELRLGRSVSVNPEVSFWFRDFFGETVHVVPGVTLNLRSGRFFVGAGVIRRISDWAEEASGSVVPKLRAGFMAGPVKLGLDLLFLDQTNDFIFGMTFGVGF